jgi:hypothetical protein
MPIGEVFSFNRAGKEPAQGEHVTVREVDQLQDAVHERIAQGNQGVHRAGRDPDQHDGEEVARRLDEIHEQPGDEQGDEDAAEQGREGRTPASEERRQPGLLLGAG